MTAFKPQIIEDKRESHGYAFVTFALQIRSCPICDRLMMYPKVRGLFPGVAFMQQKDQMKALDIVGVGEAIPGDTWGRHACEICTAEGKVFFECFICKEQRPANERHKDVYHEAVCNTCYETIPAKQWDEIMDEIDADHKYDYD